MSIEAVVARLRQNEKAALARLTDWLKIPSVSTDPKYDAECRRAAEWAAARLHEVGVDARLIETAPPGGRGHPVVFAEHAGAPGYAGPHVLFYGHYDVQPSDPLHEWKSPPFEPVMAPAIPGGPGERIVARGAVDDKGQVSTFLEALRAWKEAEGSIPVRVTILLEGEEESGSVNLERFIKERSAALKKADVCLISDTNMFGRDQPAITYGVRGLTYTEVRLHASDQDLHSGLWGGRTPNPINELVKVLSQLWDKDRRVTLPGFYDGVHTLAADVRKQWGGLGFDPAASLKKIGLPPQSDVGEAGFTALEREWGRPTCDINGVFGGYMGDGAKTVIPAWAGAKVSFRLVDDQDPKRVAQTFEKWLQERTPPGCRWEFHMLSDGPPATVATDSPYLQAARRALSAASGKQAALIKSGGSIPVVGMFRSMLGLETVLMGFGLEDDRVHSPNEKFEVACFRLGSEAHARLIHEFASMK